MPGTEKGTNTTRLFAGLWRHLAHEFLEEDSVNEYNSLNHGFRVTPGGFKLAIGLEKSYEVSPPDNEIRVIGESKYGTSFYSIEIIPRRKGNRNLFTRKVSLNWTIEKTALLIQLIGMSIANTKLTLEIVNGGKPQSGKFFRPAEDGDFEKPWNYLPGVTRFSEDPNIEVESIPSVTRAELIEEIGKVKT